MESMKKPVKLKVFVDKEKKKVMFAEADETFVEVLFSYFTLPLGTITRLSKKYSKDTKLGSLTSLYESVVNLDVKCFSSQEWKAALVNPKNSSYTFCQQLKVNLDETVSNHHQGGIPVDHLGFPRSQVHQCGLLNPQVHQGGLQVNHFGFSKSPVQIQQPIDVKQFLIQKLAPKHIGYRGNSIFVKSKANFVITDDLNVVPVMLDKSIAFLTSLGVQDINLLEESAIYFGVEEFLKLLNWSLYTDTPLTNLVLGGSASSVTDSKLSNLLLNTSKSGQIQRVKLMVQKSNKKLLCAHVERPFVELLFSFLTIPLGAFIRLTKDDPYPLGIYNLYNSISYLGDEKHLKSEDVKTKLLFPKIAEKYPRVTDYLPIYEADASPGHFLNEHETFIVSNDLEVTAYPSMATISKFNKLGIPVGDMEVVEVNIGEQEALSILKASLGSTSALSDCLNAFSKKRKHDDLQQPSLGSSIFIV